MAISSLPTPPQRSDSANFATRADAFLAALPTFANEANTLQTEVNATQTSINATASAAAASAAAAAASVIAAQTQATQAGTFAAASASAANFQGDYSAGVTYAMGQSVAFNGATYYAKQSTTGNAPTNTTFWHPVVSSVPAFSSF